MFLSFDGQTQEYKPKWDLDTGMEFLDDISYFWKLDSLGNNGFRYAMFKGLLTLPKNQISVPVLLDKLGRPNEKKGSNTGISYYVYHVIDGKRLPEANVVQPLIVWKILFIYENGVLNAIGMEHGDY